MAVDEPGVERILSGQRLARQAVRLTGESEEGREAAWQVRRAGQGGEDSGRVEAGETQAWR